MANPIPPAVRKRNQPASRRIVGFDGLTGATGAGSLCLDSNKQVVYNSASDACLSSTRATKHEISPLVVDAIEQVLALQPVSFVYNDGDGRTRYGFIAEDTATVDAHLATYDASSVISGIDDRAILATVVKAIKDLYAQVREYFARTEQLEERVSALEAQLAATAAGAPSVGNTNEAPSGSPTSGLDADTPTTTTPAATDLSAANDNPQPQGAEQSSHDGNDPVAEDTTTEPEPEAEEVAVQEPTAQEPAAEPLAPEPEAANDNSPLPTAEAI